MIVIFDLRVVLASYCSRRWKYLNDWYSFFNQQKKDSNPRPKIRFIYCNRLWGRLTIVGSKNILELFVPEKESKQRVRKRDWILGIFKENTTTNFYVEMPTPEPMEVAGNDAIDGGAPMTLARSAFPEMLEAIIVEAVGDKNLREKVKFSLQNWLGSR